MPQFDHDGASIYFETSGDGAPLLLLAGLASDVASWGPLPPLLTGRRLIMMDNRGSGRTRSEGPIGIDALVEDVRALLDHLALGQVDVVGHSMGGMIGLLLAARHPDRVRRLVTMTSGVVVPSRRILLHELGRLYENGPPTDFFRMLYQWLFSEPFFADERNVTAAALASTMYPYRQSPADYARQLTVFDSQGDWRVDGVRCPVLALSGQNDILAPTSAVAALHRPVQGVMLKEVPGVAHSLHWENPKEIARLITKFLG